METRAKHITVGLFVLLVILGIAGFCLWAANVQTKQDYSGYFIRFSGSVAQLRIDSSVLFGGIPVGRVTDVRIDPDNSELARVDISVRNGTPIRQDSKASMEIQGLAGGVALQITRGSRDAALLQPGQEIRSSVSPLERLTQKLPNLLDQASNVADRLNNMLSDDNQKAFTDAIQNLQQLSANLNKATEHVPDVVNTTQQTMQNLANASDAFQKLAVQLQGTVGNVQGNVQHTTEDISKAAQNFAEAANRLTAMLDENRAPLKQFTGSALYQTTELVSDLRQLVASMSRIAQQIERDPARFLLGDRNKGVEAK
ncbi:MAG TPA: MlaD family protein [Terriglobales bacterium]|nr:MlaD family protein [Terriglobales bacterium]